MIWLSWALNWTRLVDASTNRASCRCTTRKVHLSAKTASSQKLVAASTGELLSEGVTFTSQVVRTSIGSTGRRTSLRVVSLNTKEVYFFGGVIFSPPYELLRAGSSRVDGRRLLCPSPGDQRFFLVQRFTAAFQNRVPFIIGVAESVSERVMATASGIRRRGEHRGSAGHSRREVQVVVWNIFTCCCIPFVRAPLSCIRTRTWCVLPCLHILRSLKGPKWQWLLRLTDFLRPSPQPASAEHLYRIGRHLRRWLSCRHSSLIRSDSTVVRSRPRFYHRFCLSSLTNCSLTHLLISSDSSALSETPNRSICSVVVNSYAASVFSFCFSCKGWSMENSDSKRLKWFKFFAFHLPWRYWILFNHLFMYLFCIWILM